MTLTNIEITNITHEARMNEKQGLPNPYTDPVRWLYYETALTQLHIENLEKQNEQ